MIKEGCELYTLYINPVGNEQGLERGNSATTKDMPYIEPFQPSISGVGIKDETNEAMKKHIPEEYHRFVKVFSAGEATKLAEHRLYDIKIDTEENKLPPIGKLYNMSEKELKALKTYIDNMLNKGFIRPSNLSIGAPVLFAKKKDGGLRLCVDYRALNRLTCKDRYPLPLIGNLIDQLRQAKIYSKIDFRDGYYNVRIAKNHKWKTAFRTRYRFFEYLVMPFGLMNAPSTFQHFMNDLFHDMVDIFVIVYLDDILIFSKNLEQHQENVTRVLQHLQDNNLHAKPEKCEFHAQATKYLGVIVTPDGVKMDPSKVQVIKDWPTPTTVKELQSFLGFANFY